LSSCFLEPVPGACHEHEAATLDRNAADEAVPAARQRIGATVGLVVEAQRHQPPAEAAELDVGVVCQEQLRLVVGFPERSRDLVVVQLPLVCCVYAAQTDQRRSIVFHRRALKLIWNFASVLSSPRAASRRHRRRARTARCSLCCCSALAGNSSPCKGAPRSCRRWSQGRAAMPAPISEDDAGASAVARAGAPVAAAAGAPMAAAAGAPAAAGVPAAGAVCAVAFHPLASS